MQLINSATFGLLLSSLPSALAGIVVIGSPSDGTNVTAGSTIPVDIQKYVSSSICYQILQNILQPSYCHPSFFVSP